MKRREKNETKGLEETTGIKRAGGETEKRRHRGKGEQWRGTRKQSSK